MNRRHAQLPNRSNRYQPKFLLLLPYLSSSLFFGYYCYSMLLFGYVVTVINIIFTVLLSPASS